MRPASMSAGRAVKVVVHGHGFCPQRFPEQEVTDIDTNTLRLGVESRSDEEPDVLVLHGLISREALAFEIGVDRHLGITASGDSGDVIDGRNAAPLDKLLLRLQRQNQFHDPTLHRPQASLSAGPVIGALLLGGEEGR